MGMYFVKDWYCQKKKKTYQGIWVPKTWNGMSNFNAIYIWKDTLSNNPQIYYSDNNNNHYVLDTSTSTWSNKSWVGGEKISGNYIWSDGKANYCVYNSFDWDYSYALQPNSNQWKSMTWTKQYYPSYAFYPYADYVWKDDSNIYYSDGSEDQYHLIDNNVWEGKGWYGAITKLFKPYIWTDGDNVYYSGGNKDIWTPIQYVLDKSTSTWTSKTWNGISTSILTGSNIWTDGNDIYFSSGKDYQYVLDKSTSTWNKKTWQGLDNISPSAIWTDGDHIYYSSGTNQYELT